MNVLWQVYPREHGHLLHHARGTRIVVTVCASSHDEVLIADNASVFLVVGLVRLASAVVFGEHERHESFTFGEALLSFAKL